MPDPLNALRTADPARELPAATPGELETMLAAIDTSAAPPPARTRRIPRRALVGILVLASAGSVAVATVMRPWSRDDTRYAMPGSGPDDAPAVFAREYAAAAKALTLPPGISWPTRTPPEGSGIGTGRGGEGESTAVLIALTRWRCELVRAHNHNDRAAVTTAAAALNDLIDHHIVEVPAGTPEDGAAPSDIPGPIAQFGSGGQQPIQTMFKRQVAEAVAGDISELKASCAANS